MIYRIREYIFGSLLFLLMFLVCEGQTNKIKLNQVGFFPFTRKVAVVRDANAAEYFYLINSESGDTVYTGELGAPQIWQYSNEAVRLIDFTAFTPVGNGGEYEINVPGIGNSYPVVLSPDVLYELIQGVLKAYYYQRASCAISVLNGGAWNRPAGHPDTAVVVHGSAASPERPEGTVISAPKGWYDAGDFNKYIVNSGISTWSMLAAYEHFKDLQVFNNINTNIPESGNAIPDILDEALWNLRWMLKMQDPYDGGVYHKLTSPNFAGVIMPHQDTQTRYVVQKSTPATLDFAAVMAQASRIFEEFEVELSGFADSCLQAAEYAFQWAKQHPNVMYDQQQINQNYSPAINTGEYGDYSAVDEFIWAATELFITTGADSFLTGNDPLSLQTLNVPWWQNVGTLAFYSLAFHREEVASSIDTTEVIRRLIVLADQLLDSYQNSAYDVAMGFSESDFVWGSNSIAANQGIALVMAYLLKGEQGWDYLQAALSNLDYLLGRNATGYCFVTGFGERSPGHPHHRQSEADVIPMPVPGFLVGGPNPGQQDGCQGYPSNLPALSYLDNFCSYSTNEIAINWNAALLYLSVAIQAICSDIFSGITPPGNDNQVPDLFQLFQNFPNPFNDSTEISFYMSESGVATIRVFDLSGKLVGTLLKTKLDRGLHRIKWYPEGLPSGVYIYSFQVDGNNLQRKCVYLK